MAKYADHLPLYRQATIFGCSGCAIPRSTLAAWVGVCGVQLQPLVDALKNAMFRHIMLHADETPVAMLKPGNKKTHRAYLWSYAAGAFEELKAVVYDFCETRAGEHAKAFLGQWEGSLVWDDFSGYKASFAGSITEVGCLGALAAQSLLTCILAKRARLQRRLVRTSANAMTLGARSSIWALNSRCKSDKQNQNHLPKRFTSGCCCNADKSRTDQPQPRPKYRTTDSSAGLH